uniref:DEP domain containing 1a n=1 Tax=Neolamprologus brichardi TaxID=32507 RepID=A0A3Q4IBM3_NEOBR
MSSHVISPGPYRATKLWNEVTRLFRAGMPLRKHRQNFRHYASCFTASAAVDWLHQLLCNNSNFGPDVTRQQTVQLLKKFLKNHVIEDVKGRWGTEDLEDNNVLYRFPSTSPLKPIPCSAPASESRSIKKRPSFKDKEGFFRFRSTRRQEKETQENVDPALRIQQEGDNQPEEEQQKQRRELTVEDEQEIWRDITLTHLQRILDVPSLDEVLDHRYVNPQNIIHNMTKVNKHGVVTLDDKTNDLPDWVLSAMRSLANWPKYNGTQQSYPGFERDVFKTVSDYFYSLPQPLLTYELYELFINVLVFCGYVAAPSMRQHLKRKKSDLPAVPPPAKSSFRSTECLLLSLLRQGTCDETESPMSEVIGGKLQSRLAALKGGGGADADDGPLGGSCISLSTVVPTRPQTRSCSLETILDDSAPLTRQQLFQSSDSLASWACSSRSQDDSSSITTPHTPASCLSVNSPSSQCQASSASHPPSLSSCHPFSSSFRPFPSSFSSAATKAQGSNAATGPRPASSTSNLWTLPAPAAVRRCLSSLEVSHLSQPVSLLKAPVSVSAGVLQPQCERVAIEALQLCTLLLPPASRRKLQLLMRMASRISQNVDMPRLHPAIGTRTLMVHTFSGCVLGSAEECDLDELLATRLVSFLMDHQQSILSVPEYLLGAISDHIQYLRTSQTDKSDPVCPPLPVYTFCHQISGAEFEQQKLESSQKAMEELLEILVTDQNISEKDRRKKLKQFQKQYPDIYRQRFPSPDRESKTDNKPKIKPPLLNIKKTKAFSIRN